MKKLLALLLGAAASLSFSYFLIVADPEVTIRRGDNGTTVALTLANSDGPYVPAPQIAAATPVPIPETVQMAETIPVPVAVPAPELTFSPPMVEEKTQLVEKAESENNLAGKSVPNLAGKSLKAPTPKDVAAAFGTKRPARVNQTTARAGGQKVVVRYVYVPAPPSKDLCIRAYGDDNSWNQAIGRSGKR